MAFTLRGTLTCGDARPVYISESSFTTRCNTSFNSYTATKDELLYPSKGIATIDAPYTNSVPTTSVPTVDLGSLELNSQYPAQSPQITETQSQRDAKHSQSTEGMSKIQTRPLQNHQPALDKYYLRDGDPRQECKDEFGFEICDSSPVTVEVKGYEETELVELFADLGATADKIRSASSGKSGHNKYDDDLNDNDDDGYNEKALVHLFAELGDVADRIRSSSRPKSDDNKNIDEELERIVIGGGGGGGDGDDDDEDEDNDDDEDEDEDEDDDEVAALYMAYLKRRDYEIAIRDRQREQAKDEREKAIPQTLTESQVREMIEKRRGGTFGCAPTKYLDLVKRARNDPGSLVPTQNWCSCTHWKRCICGRRARISKRGGHINSWFEGEEGGYIVKDGSR